MPGGDSLQGGSLPRCACAAPPRDAAQGRPVPSVVVHLAKAPHPLRSSARGNQGGLMNWTETISLVGAVAGVIAAVAQLWIVVSPPS